MNEAENDTPGLVRLSEGLGPVSEAKARAFAQALRGMADGFDQWRWWSRPDPLVMNTLRRAADGWTTLRRLRAQGLSDAPAAIVSANAFDKGLENDLGITPADFLVKPVCMAADGAAAGRRAACAGRTGAPVFSQQDIKDINTMRRG